MYMFAYMCIIVLVKCNFCPSQIRSGLRHCLEVSLYPRGINFYPCFCTAFIVLFHYYNIMNLSIIFSQTMANKGLCTFDSPFKSNQNVKMVTKNAGYNMRIWDPNSAKNIGVTHHAWESLQQTSKESGPMICLNSFFLLLLSSEPVVYLFYYSTHEHHDKAHVLKSSNRDINDAMTANRVWIILIYFRGYICMVD